MQLNLPSVTEKDNSWQTRDKVQQQCKEGQFTEKEWSQNIRYTQRMKIFPRKGIKKKKKKTDLLGLER